MKVPIEKPLTAEELVHYGVKGMRWGYRKREETVSRRERRAIKRDIQVDIAQKKIDEIKSKPARNWYSRRTQNKKISDLERIRDQNVKDAKDIREGHLTDHQKKVLIGAGAVAAVLVVYSGYKLTESGQARQFIQEGRKFLGQDVSWKKNASLSAKMDADGIMKNVVRQVNPDYGEIGTKMNCRRCTLAYEMRRRGFDVNATRSVAGIGQGSPGLMNAINPESHQPTYGPRLFAKAIREEARQQKQGVSVPASPFLRALHNPNGIEPILDKTNTLGKSPIEKAVDIFNALGEHPEGARGELGVQWKMGGGHSMAWEIIKGRAVVFDTQSGQAYTHPAAFADEMGHAIVEAGATRLDDLPLNHDFLRRWVKNAN